MSPSGAPLEFEVVPEIGLKHSSIELILGTPLNVVISLLQQNSSTIHNVDFLYSKKNPFFEDIQIRLVKSGINLFFEGRNQLLKLIEVDALSSIVLKYNGKVFSEPSAEATMERIGTFFASTHPGAYDERQKMYVQSWRGLSFCFPTTNSSNVEVTPGFSPSLHSLRYDANSQPKLTKMSIFKGTIGGSKDEEELIIPLASYCGQNRTLLADVLVDMGRIEGCSFTFLTQNGEAAPDRTSQADLDLIEMTREIRFGDSSAQVLCALGAPSRVYYKSEDKMIIHRPAGKDGRDEPDFFFNYFSMGIDILLDALTKRVKKFILHTNMPGHYDFGIYSRCNFRAALGGKETTEINTETKFSEMSLLFTVDGSPVKPVVVTHNNEGERNPFGPTYCYGIPGLIVEVMETSGHIAALTLYEATT